ncbi:hypothetical protein [Pantanalinema sp. GBBB05]|uniref:MarR family transcriptional regulator n=1 Tax=Pantanalinema sp. GBBB05 TaxID=2604139 RepID=UPI001DD2AB79|nr:hypothetical protein [Pantanalinema sp. GBBB05]
MPASSATDKQRQKQILAIVERHPGITISRLARHMGLNGFYTGSGKTRPNPTIHRLCTQMAGQGEIEMHPSQQYFEEPKVYPIGWQPQRKRPLFEPAKDRVDQTVKIIFPGDSSYPEVEVKTVIPDAFRPRSLRDTNPQKTITYQFKSTQPATPQENDMANEVLSKILDAINEAEQTAVSNQSYTLPNKYQLCISAGISKAYFNQETHASNAACRAYQAAEERLEVLRVKSREAEQPKAVEPSPETEVLQCRVKELQAALELETEAKEALQRTLAEQQEVMGELRDKLWKQGNRLDELAKHQEHQSGQPDIGAVLTWFQSEADKERLTISRCTQEIDEATRDREAAERKLALLTAQIEDLQERVGQKASTNGHHKQVLVGAN